MTTDDTPTTQLSRTPASPSSADVPTTALTPEEVEAIGLTDTMTRPFPVVGEDSSAPPASAWSAPGASGTSPDGADAERTRSAESAADAVWHGPIAPLDPEAPRGPNPPAIVWGLVLLVVAALLVGVVAGARIDPVTAGIVVLAGLGAALLVVALVPRGHRDRPTD